MQKQLPKNNAKRNAAYYFYRKSPRKNNMLRSAVNDPEHQDVDKSTIFIRATRFARSMKARTFMFYIPSVQAHSACGHQGCTANAPEAPKPLVINARVPYGSLNTKEDAMLAHEISTSIDPIVSLPLVTVRRQAPAGFIRTPAWVATLAVAAILAGCGGGGDGGGSSSATAANAAAVASGSTAAAASGSSGATAASASTSTSGTASTTSASGSASTSNSTSSTTAAAIAASSAANTTAIASVASLLLPNTAAPNFTGSSNGNLSGQSDISTVNVHSLLYPGHTTLVLAHYTPWWGAYQRGVNVGYNSGDPLQAQRTFDSMSQRGVDGVIIDWYGKSPQQIDANWQNSLAAFAQHPTMKFSIMFDHGISLTPCAGCDLTATLIDDLNYVAQNYFSNPQYLKRDGHPVVSEFAMQVAGTVDWARVQAAHPEVYWLHQHEEGYAVQDSAGGYAWVDAPNRTTPLVQTADLTRLTNFNSFVAARPALTGISGAWKGFDDTLAFWASPNHYVPQQCGATWLSTFANTNAHFSTQNQLPYLQLVTWNDYEEGSALEPGIASCAKVQVTASANQLSTSVSYAETVDHLELYKQNGVNSFALVGTYPSIAGITSMPAQKGGVYVVKAVGKPFMQNTVSAVVVGV